MDNEFEIPLTYKGKELLLPARLLVQGYVYKFEVTIGETKVLYEKDDEGLWRALIEPDDLPHHHGPDLALLQEIASTLDTLFE
jgi:hypothetical protein